MSKRENLNRDGGKGEYKELLTLALLVGILPPTWALISPYIGVHVGPIALIAAAYMVQMGINSKTLLK